VVRIKQKNQIEANKNFNVSRVIFQKEKFLEN